MRSRQQSITEAPEETGPFIVQRVWQDRPTTYATKTGGWSTEREKAWKFDTRKQAQFILRGRDGEIVPLASPPPMARTGGPDLPALASRSGPLSSDERRALNNLEHQVENGLNEARAALLQIRDGELYREQFGTWEEYMAKRWGFSARHGHRLCDWAEVERNLLTEGKKEANGQEVTNLVTLPARESVARPLARLKAAEQLPAWREAQEAAAPARPTAKHVEAAVNKRAPRADNGRGQMEDGKGWPQPNEHGIYDSAGATRRCFSAKGALVKLIALQVGSNLWAYGVDCNWNFGGAVVSLGYSFGLSDRLLLGSLDHALQEAALAVRSQLEPFLKKGGMGPKQARLAQSIVDWTQEFSSAENGQASEPAAKTAPQTWDELPLSGTAKAPADNCIGSSLREAMAFLGSVEDGLAEDPEMLSRVHRAFALLRPALQKYAGMDNRRAERCAAKEGIPIVDAKFHVIDGLVEAKAALALLRAASPADRVEKEIYHAEKAVDHLQCLKVLLTEAVVVKPKGKG